MNANATPRTNRELLATLPVGTVARNRSWPDSVPNAIRLPMGWMRHMQGHTESGIDQTNHGADCDGPFGIVVLSRPDVPEPAKPEPAKLTLREAWLPQDERDVPAVPEIIRYLIAEGVLTESLWDNARAVVKAREGFRAARERASK